MLPRAILLKPIPIVRAMAFFDDFLVVDGLRVLMVVADCLSVWLSAEIEVIEVRREMCGMYSF